MAVLTVPKNKVRATRKPSTRIVAPAPSSSALDLRHRMHLSQPLFARLLSVSIRTLASLESGKAPTETVSRRLKELSRLVSALAEVIRVEAIGTWLQTPNDAFEGAKPLEVMERGEGDRLWSMIFFLRSGTPG